MYPKEKAKELVNNYLPILFGKKTFYKKSDYFKSKQCALIAVDEMLLEHFGDISEYAMRRYNYLLKVKQEIENYKTN